MQTLNAKNYTREQILEILETQKERIRKTEQFYNQKFFIDRIQEKINDYLSGEVIIVESEWRREDGIEYSTSYDSNGTKWESMAVDD